MREIWNELRNWLESLSHDLGRNADRAGGRSAEVNRRLSAIMGRIDPLESPKEEYLRYAALARSACGERRTAD